MIPKIRWGLLAAALSSACGAAAPATTAPSNVSSAPLAVNGAAPTRPCCSNADDARAWDGREVALEAIYERAAFNVKGARVGDDARASTVYLRVSESFGVALERYYVPEGARPPDELARFAGKRVRVVGTLRASTPFPPGEEPKQASSAMVGPCLVDVRSIELAP